VADVARWLHHLGTVYSRFDSKVDNMADTADAVASVEVEIWVSV
jgi:hypothetical protein